MSRIDHALDPTDASVVINALEFDTNWLLELSNADPAQFIDHAERLYSIMNRMQLVTSRFARVCNDNDYPAQRAVHSSLSAGFRKPDPKRSASREIIRKSENTSTGHST